MFETNPHNWDEQKNRMLRISKEFCQVLFILFAFLLLCSGLVWQNDKKKLEVLTVHNLRWRSASGGRPGATSPCSSPCSSPTFSLSPPSSRLSPWLDFPISFWFLPSTVKSFLWTMDKPARRWISSSSSVSSPTPPSTWSSPSRGTSFRFYCFNQGRYDILFDPISPPLDIHGLLIISYIPNALWCLRYATHSLPPLHYTYKLILSTAFSSCPSASSPWRRLRDRRRPKLEPEQWTRPRIRQLPKIFFWFDRHNEILFVWLSTGSCLYIWKFDFDDWSVLVVVGLWN